MVENNIAAEGIENFALIVLSAKKELYILEEIESHPLIDEAFDIKFGKKAIYKNTPKEANSYIITAHDSISNKAKEKSASLNVFEKRFLDNYKDASKNGNNWTPGRQADYLKEQQELLYMSEFWKCQNVKSTFQLYASA